jgi:hypothetical protein
MTDVTTIKFFDTASDDEAVIIVRAENGRVSICLSLRENGDVEVGFGRDELAKLTDALHRGESIAFP